MNEYKSFPPGWENIKVPTSSRAAMLAGMGTYAPCLPKGIWGQRAMWALVSVAGPRALPGRAVGWEPPLPAAAWEEFEASLRQAAGRYDAHTVYERRRGREGLLMLLLRSGHPIGFVKARHESPEEIDRERRALEALEATPPSSFHTPRVVGGGELGGWQYVVTTAMPAGMHRMVKGVPPAAMHDEIAAALLALPKPESTPNHWMPYHGDFTPWNLRRFRNGKPWLIDWEEAGWAPPGADAAFYRASAYAIGRAVDDDPFEHDEAAAFWFERMQHRTADNVAAGLELRPLDHGLLKAFAPPE